MSLTSGWDADVGQKKQGGAPPLPPPPAAPKRSQFGLRHIMLLSAVVAVIMASFGLAIQTRSEHHILFAVVVMAATIFLVGVFMINRLTSFGGVGWMLVVLGITGNLIVLTGWLTLLLDPVVIGGLIFLNLRRRALEQDALLWVLALAAERQRPLAPAVLALAWQTTGIYRARALRLAEALEQGMPLPDSLEFVRKSVSAPAQLIVRVGNESGRLAEALRDAATSRSTRGGGFQNVGPRIAYFCIILSVMQSVTSFVLYFILPKFKAIFNDFGVNLPVITRFVIDVSYWLTSNYIFPILLVGELLLLAYLPFAFFGYAGLHVPFLDRLFLRRHSVLILRCLSMIVEGGVPIDTGLCTLSEWYPTRWIRFRLRGALQTHAMGMSWIESLRSFGLINRADAALLDASIRVNNLPWALRELTESSERKLFQRVQVFTQVLLTLVLIAIGGLVGVLATAYFYPLVVLIERLV